MPPCFSGIQSVQEKSFTHWYDFLWLARRLLLLIPTPVLRHLRQSGKPHEKHRSFACTRIAPQPREGQAGEISVGELDGMVTCQSTLIIDKLAYVIMVRWQLTCVCVCNRIGTKVCVCMHAWVNPIPWWNEDKTWKIPFH